MWHEPIFSNDLVNIFSRKNNIIVAVVISTVREFIIYTTDELLSKPILSLEKSIRTFLGVGHHLSLKSFSWNLYLNSKHLE